MTKTIDRLTRELKWLDPVTGEEIEGALDTSEARELRTWIVSLEVEPATRPRREDDGGGRERGIVSRRRRRVIPVLALTALAAAAAVQVLVGGVPGRGTRQNRLGGVLDRAASVAAATGGARDETVAAHQFAYRKTREVSLDTTRRGSRSWSVYQRATREEWVAWDGSGLLRIESEPTRFATSADRAEWEAAGEPSFLALGFAGRTEDHWLAAGMLDRSFEQLPTGPIVLAARLESQARAKGGSTSVGAATLGEIAEDLREPGASPELRQALYEAAKLVPGIEYLGARTDPDGRRGIAVGVSGTYAGRPALYSLIFDPETAAVLATETTAPARVARRGAAGALLRARVYLEARGVEAPAEPGDASLVKFEMDSRRQPSTPFLIYGIPVPNQWSRAIDASFEPGRSRG
ncbi:MAG TPA: CU044_5270 family protein [Solirubrobacterales bacterium]